AARRRASPASPRRTGASRSSCRTPSVSFSPYSTLGTRTAGARTGRGCGCSAMRGSGSAEGRDERRERGEARGERRKALGVRHKRRTEVRRLCPWLVTNHQPPTTSHRSLVTGSFSDLGLRPQIAHRLLVGLAGELLLHAL